MIESDLTDMMNLLLCLPGQVIHANLRGADVAGFSTGIERGSRPSQICVNLLLGLVCSVIFPQCLRVLRGESFSVAAVAWFRPVLVRRQGYVTCNAL